MSQVWEFPLLPMQLRALKEFVLQIGQWHPKASHLMLQRLQSLTRLRRSEVRSKGGQMCRSRLKLSPDYNLPLLFQTLPRLGHRLHEHNNSQILSPGRYGWGRHLKSLFFLQSLGKLHILVDLYLDPRSKNTCKR